VRGGGQHPPRRGATEACAHLKSGCPSRDRLCPPRRKAVRDHHRHRPHKRSLTAVALDPHSQLLGQQRLAATSQAGRQLLAWAQQWPQRRWAVEGANGLGRGIAQLLVAAGAQVVDVPAKLAARARLLGTSSARKTDLADACSVAAAAIHHRRLRSVALEDQTVIFRLLSDRRDDLVAERTRTLSRLHVLLAALHPGGAKRELTATRAAALLRRAHPMTVVDVERKRTPASCWPTCVAWTGRSRRPARPSAPRSAGMAPP
jgi:Transposase